MSVMEKLFTRRTYRRFRQKAVPQDVVEDLIEAVRISSSAANRQPVRLVIVNTPKPWLPCSRWSNGRPICRRSRAP